MDVDLDNLDVNAELKKNSCLFPVKQLVFSGFFQPTSRPNQQHAGKLRVNGRLAL
jgi:hypothetical protein